MNKFYDIIGNIKYGWVFEITKTDDEYNGFITKYDGKIFKDVELVKIKDFLKMIPNIVSKLDDITVYRLSFDSEKRLYESAIVYSDIDNDTNKVIYKTVGNNQAKSNSLSESIFILDNKCCEKEKRLIKRVS